MEYDAVILMKYLTSALVLEYNIIYNPCVGPLETTKMYFFYYK